MNMRQAGSREMALVIVAREGLRHLAPVLSRVFTHAWVASYQVGFGPPLVRSSERLITRVRQSRGVLEKLAAYVDCCFLNEDERRRLLGTHRRLLVRAEGPVEMEELNDRSAEVLDLSVRLHHPAFAPPAAAAAMRNLGLTPELLPLKTPPEQLSGRILVRLSDPRGERLFHSERVKRIAFDPESDLGLELRIPPAPRALFLGFLTELCSGGDLAFTDLGEPLPHARASENGVEL